MKLEEIMVRGVATIRPDDNIGAAAARMKERSVGCLVATADRSIKGIITDRDLLGCIQQGHDPHGCQVSTHMSHPVVVLRPDEDHITAIDVMQRKRIKRLPLARDGKLVGIVSLSDLAALAEGEMHQVWASWTAVAGIMRAQAVQVWAAKEDPKADWTDPGRSVD